MIDAIKPPGQRGNPADIIPYQFKKGQSGNPGGKPAGTRNKIQTDFLRELSRDFSIHGASAIAAMRKTDPSGYVRTVAALLPKVIEVNSSMDELSDDLIDDCILAVRSLVAAQHFGEGASAEALTEQAPGLFALPQAAGVPQGGEIVQGKVADGGQPTGENVERGG